MTKVLAWKLIALKKLWFPELQRPDPPGGPAARAGEGVQGAGRGGPGLEAAARVAAEGRRERADEWFEETGTYQTEIDSLITRHPEELRR